MAETKFCKHCGEIIDADCVVCPKCGKQVEELKGAQAQGVVINNNVQQNATTQIVGGKPKDKVVALLLCIFLGVFGAHKFYEGKTGMGILYLLTGGLLGVGWLIDIFVLIGKPNPYYV